MGLTRIRNCCLSYIGEINRVKFVKTLKARNGKSIEFKKIEPLGIDKEKLFLQLERLEKHFGELWEIRGKLLRACNKDNVLFSAAERLLQVAVEDCLNIGSQMIAGLGLARPDTYREIFTNLKEAGILSQELWLVMENFASFRDRLVHLYWKVSKKEIIAKLDEIGFLKTFAKQIAQNIEKMQ